ncbi:acetyltransferase [Algoriphagus halophytocola]|uniref:Acetyltransferase n=1 Tax=Algoriphagus halophytocola TaxID=2991499 RepID=A0ABY6MGV2_9BACT|nr:MULTISPECIES: acetyltransferase [unclassified Algoriphagus]UZD23030.1 acetyltransferase [Algoriphagus sp. TR-M5]WBL44322.1 acetyltransferase [Algoriphagus sp. TR-M9]
MVIAGAGGHGKEVKHVLLSQGFPSGELVFFDEDPEQSNSLFEDDFLIVSVDELKVQLKKDPRFVLGVGNPVFREKLFHLLTSLGGSAFGINCVSKENSMTTNQNFDAMPFSFIGPLTTVGRGALINTRAHVHHEAVVGEFSEVGPGAMLLGGAKIGKKCRIGAGAVILPGIELGDEVIVGAGAVVTKRVARSSRIFGVPARVIE